MRWQNPLDKLLLLVEVRFCLAVQLFSGPSRNCHTTDLPIKKIYLAVQLEAKQAYYEPIEQKSKTYLHYLPSTLLRL